MRLKFEWLNRNLIGFGITSFFNDFSHEMTSAVLPAFVEQLTGVQYAPSALGLITGISDAAASIVKVWSGFLTDKITKYKFFLIIGYALTPLFSGLIGTAHSVWQVLVYKTVAWIGRGMREPMRDTWIAKIIAPPYYGRAFGFHRFCDTLGSIIGPLIAFFALKTVSLRTVFFISFIPGIFSVLALIFLTTEETQKNYKRGTYHSWREQLMKLPRNFIYFLFVMFLFGMANYSKLLLVYRAQELLLGYRTFIIATSMSVLLYIILNIFRAISELSIGSLSDYVSKKNLLALFGFGLFALVNILLLFALHAVWFWILLFMLAGISLGSVTAVEKAYAATLLPEEVRGTGFGLLQTIDGIGDLISSIVVGFLWSTISPEVGFIFATILSVIATLLLLVR